MTNDFMKKLLIAIAISIGLVLAVLGSVLMGTAPSKTFINPGDAQFIAGFTFIMVFAMYIINLILYFCICDWVHPCKYALIINFILILLIVGAVLVGISPLHEFINGTTMFITGFVFLIVMAVVLVALIIVCACC